MPLGSYSPPTSRIQDSRASRVVLEANTSSQTDENGLQVSGPREVHQEGEIDHAQHWGFSSRPPQGTELIQILDEYGRVVIAERIPCPVSLADGDACLWTSATSYIKINAAGEEWIRSKAGQLVHIGDGSSTEYGAAWWSSKEGEASQVATGTALNQWMAKVVADLGELHAHMDSIVTAVNVIGNAIKATLYPGWVDITYPAAVTTTALAGGDVHSYVSSGSAHVKVD
jgi:hypothetical protein